MVNQEHRNMWLNFLVVSFNLGFISIISSALPMRDLFVRVIILISAAPLLSATLIYRLRRILGCIKKSGEWAIIWRERVPEPVPKAKIVQIKLWESYCEICPLFSNRLSPTEVSTRQMSEQEKTARTFDG